MVDLVVDGDRVRARLRHHPDLDRDAGGADGHRQSGRPKGKVARALA